MTTGTCNFTSSISNIARYKALISGTGGSALGLASCVVLSVISQFLDQVQFRDTSQLINDISIVLQKLLRCFNGTENLPAFVFLLLAVFPVMLVLYLKDSEFVIGSTRCL